MAESTRQGPTRDPEGVEKSPEVAATLDLRKASPESVSILLSTVQRLFDDELARGRELDTKMSTLAGFSGTILALTATLSKDLLPVRVTAFEEVAIRTLFVIAIVSLAAAAMTAVAGALLPHRRMRIESSAIREFADFPLIALEKIQIEGNLLKTHIEEMEFERVRNNRKASVGRAAGVILIIGFVAMAVLALARLFVAG